MAVEMLRGPDHIARRNERVFMNGGDVRPLAPEGKRGVGGSFGKGMKLPWPPPARAASLRLIWSRQVASVSDPLTRWRAAAIGRSESAAAWPYSQAFERPHGDCALVRCPSRKTG